MSQARAVVIIVLDSAGIGGAPDADEFGDSGSATLPHIAEAVGGLSLPNLAALGLGNIAEIKGVEPAAQPEGAFGAMVERSPGKDTTTGHWEIAGIILERPFPTYPNGFPDDVMTEFARRAGVGWLGNVAASGTEIIATLGAEHLATGKPIVYTSADSVFQIAAHIEVMPLERLYEICQIARAILRGEHEVGRVIARPFRGRPGAFERTPDRHDFSVLPPGDTLLDNVVAAGLEVRAVGKISDIFGGRGISSSRPTRSNDEGITAVIEEL
jgi:phosphopentomutase